MQVERGATRTVFLTQRWAIKIPTFLEWRLFLHGLLANMQEARWSGFSDLLCPVVFHLPMGFLVVMPRAEVRDWDFPITDEEKQMLIDADLDFVSDLKPDNFGYLDGKLVCIDYGSRKG